MNVDLTSKMKILQILWNNFTSKTKSDGLEPKKIPHTGDSDTLLNTFLLQDNHKNKNTLKQIFGKKNGVPGEIRTHDLSLRRRTLYPTELQRQF